MTVLRSLLVAATLVMFGCAAQSTARVDHFDAATQFATDEALEESAAVLAAAYTPSPEQTGYTTLCGGKECSGTAMKYTRAFREVAALALALRSLQAVCTDPTLDEAEQLVLQDAQRSLDAMNRSVARLHATFEQLDPRRDFTSDYGRQQDASVGLQQARRQLDDARAATVALRVELARRIGEAGPIEVGWEDARSPEDPRVILKQRVRQNPALAAELAAHDNSIDAMIASYGRISIEDRLAAEERRAAAVRSVSTTRALVSLELTKVAVVGPLLSDGVRDWFTDARVAVAACLIRPRGFEIGLLYGADGVVSALEVVDADPSVTACAGEGLIGTALAGTPLPSGGVVVLTVKPEAGR